MCTIKSDSLVKCKIQQLYDSQMRINAVYNNPSDKSTQLQNISAYYVQRNYRHLNISDKYTDSSHQSGWGVLCVYFLLGRCGKRKRAKYKQFKEKERKYITSTYTHIQRLPPQKAKYLLSGQSRMIAFDLYHELNY